MPDTPTPGAVAYAAFMAAQYPKPSTFRDVDVPWEDISNQHAWEAAAEAVLTQALADRVWARQAPSSRWQEEPHDEEDDHA